MYNVVLIRSNPVRPYPRLEKMANCLVKNGHNVTVLAWDRDMDYEPRNEQLKLKSGTVPIIRIGIKGQFSGGMKKNLRGLIKFQRFIYSWLKQHKSEFEKPKVTKNTKKKVATKSAKTQKTKKTTSKKK